MPVAERKTAIEAEAISRCAPSIELLDKLLAALESRRSRALRGISEYRADLSQRLRASSDRTIDAKVFADDDIKGRAPSGAA